MARELMSFSEKWEHVAATCILHDEYAARCTMILLCCSVSRGNDYNVRDSELQKLNLAELDTFDIAK
jgi:hypothetical protein